MVVAADTINYYYYY